jgi:hypothetical protein
LLGIERNGNFRKPLPINLASRPIISKITSKK